MIKMELALKEQDDYPHYWEDESAQRTVQVETLAVIIIGEDGVITDLNNAAENTFGYNLYELQGRHFAMLIPEHVQRFIQRRLDHDLDKDYSDTLFPSIKFIGLNKDGDNIPLELSTELYRAYGRSEMLLMFRDVCDFEIDKDNQRTFCNSRS